MLKMFNDSINDYKMCLIYGKVEYYDTVYDEKNGEWSMLEKIKQI